MACMTGSSGAFEFLDPGELSDGVVRLRLRELWITCNPDNIASRRTCEVARADFAGIVDLPPETDMYEEGERQMCRYRLELRSAD